MKNLIISIGLLFSIIATVSGQNIGTDVSMAFKNGDATILGKYLAPKIALALPGMTMNQTEKGAAITSISNFFKANDPKGFKIIHQSEKEEQGFIVGELAAATGNFRINCLFKKQNGSTLINQIRIDKQ